MAKTRAEIQKQYRERKKKQDPNYLERERKRAGANRVPAALLSKKKLKKRREKNKQYCAKYREAIRKQRKTEKTAENEIQNDEITSTTSPKPSTSTTRSTADKMLVRFDFGEKSVQGKKRSKSLRKARYQTEKLSSKLQNQIRMTKKWQKRYERLKEKLQHENMETESSDESQPQDTGKSTPKSKTLSELRSAGVSPRKLPKSVVKRLQMGNCLLQGLRHSRQNIRTEHEKRQADRIICSGLKKYRFGRILNKEISLNRKRLRSVHIATTIARKRRNQERYTALKMEIETYFERDDISRCMPGKNDAVKVGSEKKQVRILNDYLVNLHEKFLMENREKNISFSAFCKLRPRNIKTTSLLSRNTCLCTIHQNMALKLKCLKSFGMDISINPEVVKKTVSLDDMEDKLNSLENSEKEFEHWKRVDVDGKKKMRIVKAVMPHDDFVSHILKEYKAFLEHTDRISQQYSAIYQLKETLKVGHVIVQMDFAENFQCQTMDEIQSAYWNATSVTLHPVVAYFRTEENENLQHKNYVFVSDLNHHNSTAVITILHKLMPLLKEQIPGIDTIHYWTDSPSSQYRNRFIINVIANHKKIFDVNACWNYFETGHGKGPCDGIGGTCKRRAAEAVKQGKATIQDANEFYSWAHTNQKGIAYHFYTESEYNSTAERINTKTKPIPGTMTVHAVVAEGDGKIRVRRTSCYCSGCVDGTAMCDGWVSHSTNVQERNIIENQEDPDEPENNYNDQDEVTFDTGDFVGAVYQDSWYIGKVISIDNIDKDAEISFLQKRKQFWQWPSREDKVSIYFKDIICLVNQPEPTGKSKRMLKLVGDDKEKIEKAFNAWKANN